MISHLKWIARVVQGDSRFCSMMADFRITEMHRLWMWGVSLDV